jgi:hypothetical protein
VAGNIFTGGRVENCYATGDVTGTSSGAYAGGVAGLVNGSLEYCYATGTVRGDEVGGVAGTFITKVTACVGLNKNVIGGYYTGRVAGGSYYNSLTGNAGLDTMQRNGSSTTWTNVGANANDGSDVTDATAKTLAFWTGLGWSTAIWNFDGVNCPTLK